MENTYIIVWKAKYRDGSGRGKKGMSLEEAQRLAEELNRDYPEFEHTAAPVDTPQAASTVELATPEVPPGARSAEPEPAHAGE